MPSPPPAAPLDLSASPAAASKKPQARPPLDLGLPPVVRSHSIDQETLPVPLVADSSVTVVAIKRSDRARAWRQGAWQRKTGKARDDCEVCSRRYRPPPSGAPALPCLWTTSQMSPRRRSSVPARPRGSVRCAVDQAEAGHAAERRPHERRCHRSGHVVHRSAPSPVQSFFHQRRFDYSCPTTARSLPAAAAASIAIVAIPKEKEEDKRQQAAATRRCRARVQRTLHILRSQHLPRTRPAARTLLLNLPPAPGAGSIRLARPQFRPQLQPHPPVVPLFGMPKEKEEEKKSDNKPAATRRSPYPLSAHRFLYLRLLHRQRVRMRPASPKRRPACPRRSPTSPRRRPPLNQTRPRLVLLAASALASVLCRRLQRPHRRCHRLAQQRRRRRRRRRATASPLPSRRSPCPHSAHRSCPSFAAPAKDETSKPKALLLSLRARFRRRQWYRLARPQFRPQLQPHHRLLYHYLAHQRRRRRKKSDTKPAATPSFAVPASAHRFLYLRLVRRQRAG